MTSIPIHRSRPWSFLFGMTAAVALAVAAHAQTTGPDTDGDGIADAGDNCTQVANADQLDADGDNFGNLCDGDLDNNGTTDEADFELMRSVLNQESSAGPLAAAADMDGSGRVTAQDFNRLRSRINSPPGPSGLQP